MLKARVWMIWLGAVFLLPPGMSDLLRTDGGAAWAASEELEYVGADECADCHEDIEQAFRTSLHSKVSYWEVGATGCEDCHGPGSAHAQSDGDVLIGSPASLEGAAANEACLSCHDGARAQRYWQGSVHEATNVACVDCHSMHSNFEHLLNSPTEERTCFQCHKEQRTYLYKRSSHPLRDSSRRDGRGKMSCSSCHNPHGSRSEMLISANSVNDKCYECHREMQAPVLWEHSPVKESCLNCHNPHGSNHEFLLTMRRPRLCQACHEAGRHQTVAGGPTSFLVLNRSCTNCHAQVHGSNHPSGLKLKR